MSRPREEEVSSTTATVSPKRSRTEQAGPEKDLLCAVCMDFPTSSIFQCTNGHLMCSDCHSRILESCKSLCPTCRVRLSRDHPSRNMFAESILASVETTCSHSGCEAKMKFGERKEHEAGCSAKPTVCKYAPIGCVWKGTVASLVEHKKECEVRKMSAKKILKLVTAAKEANTFSKGDRGGKKVLELLSSRVRDIAIRDVLLEKDEQGSEVCSNTFMALGYAWEVVLEKNSKGNAVLCMRMVSSLRRKLRVTFFILRGPFVESNIPPSVHTVDFKRLARGNHHSHQCVLPVDEDTSEALLDLQSLHLRIGFVDRSRGVSRWFSNQTYVEDEEDDDSTGSDQDSYYSSFDEEHDHDDDSSDCSFTIL